MLIRRPQEDEAKEMADNGGKKIRFRIRNHDGKSEWLESKIAEVSVVKTSVDREERHKMRLTLRLHEVQKRVLVTLNDRSPMKYPMLLGRNFLRGDFIVEVDSKKNREMRTDRSSQEKPSPNKRVKTATKEKKRSSRTACVDRTTTCAASVQTATSSRSSDHCG